MDDKDEQEDEKDALDDSVESLCFSFGVLMKFVSCSRSLYEQRNSQDYIGKNEEERKQNMDKELLQQMYAGGMH